MDIGRRRILAGAAMTLLAPSMARAQRPQRTVRLGILLYTDPRSDPNTRAVREGMAERGYVEGQNLVIEYRSAEGRPERLRDLAVELVATKPDVIFALGGDVAPFATAATTTIPIVVAVSGNPVTGKLVASLAAPGGNVTGVTFISSELAGKRLQLLKQAAPKITRTAVIWNPDHHDNELVETQAAARTLGVQITSVEVREGSDFDHAFQATVAAGADSVVVVSSRLLVRHRSALTSFAARQRIPLAGSWGLWPESGALLSYGPDLDTIVRRATGHVDRILKGAKPAALPVEQPTKFDLVINLKIAQSLGLAVPQSLLVQAARVIE